MEEIYEWRSQVVTFAKDEMVWLFGSVAFDARH